LYILIFRQKTRRQKFLDWIINLCENRLENFVRKHCSFRQALCWYMLLNVLLTLLVFSCKRTWLSTRKISYQKNLVAADNLFTVALWLYSTRWCLLPATDCTASPHFALSSCGPSSFSLWKIVVQVWKQIPEIFRLFGRSSNIALYTNKWRNFFILVMFVFFVIYLLTLSVIQTL
jgi:hypothetical protein